MSHIDDSVCDTSITLHVFNHMSESVKDISMIQQHYETDEWHVARQGY